MKTLLLYDSMYGNTGKIAITIAETLTGDVKIRYVGNVDPKELKSVNLLIVGSPVHGGQPTKAISECIIQLPDNYLKGIKIAVFDTRFGSKDHGVGIRVLMSIIRYAAEKLAKTIEGKGGKLIIKPEGFIVTQKNGPLKKGEVKRAQEWARAVMKAAS